MAVAKATSGKCVAIGRRPALTTRSDKMRINEIKNNRKKDRSFIACSEHEPRTRFHVQRYL